MHFSREDFLKIENWLNQRSVKDSELPVADELIGGELVTVVQDGESRTMKLFQLVDQLNHMNIIDFVNVSQRNNEFNIDLRQAIELVPPHKRIPGIVITFLDEHGCWEVVQFRGAYTSQWYDMNLWGDLFHNYIDAHIYHPDDEDIEAVQEGNRKFLKFKDKPYDKAEFSGKGRKILRRNLVGVRSCSVEDDDEDYYVNILTQKDFQDENTIYVIRYDFTLDSRIRIPSNCEMVFEGGKITGGFIDLNACKLHGVSGDIKEYVDSEVIGWALGQIEYREGQIKYWNGEEWIVAGAGEFYTREEVDNILKGYVPKDDFQKLSNRVEEVNKNTIQWRELV